ncbi:UDP-N-acetylmuramoyl-L-alanyl-D-glutamate--2,6-diaminopimelate ligase [Aquisalibacillus elongatus]|uniref:UDP-N-acetylmuramoylalanyl-D-glutamate--2, 6-diaminopimelate ligase n=1 Tax=Aquisalibacillus elongatus TaxID=485577 RepID=A0A3N5CAZ0_9BACI|nr:UDP-N-acetylmuramoyl-L-alanyl-D-glutamate--2,6-diaminopimelate ligase [Aquisalibacillus elongatus]RPF53971.1 UDP-N-acetylmuramoylalanyl-D-glutamate--2,6-diaminopimelate ligase [Aquisalibacillus elongatus]
MKLLNLLDNVDYKSQSNLDDITVVGITDDSREVKTGYLFVAIEGYQSDGHHYIEEAFDNGACAVIGEQDLEFEQYIKVSNSKQVLGQLVSRYYGQPSLNKKVIGVTGTNGKTTTSYMIKSVFEENGYSCGLIGTIEYYINGESKPSKNTTPGAVTLQKLLYESQDDVVVIEISSHALKQYRVEGVQLDGAIFTNLDSEHLDYHNSMQEYFESKLLIFEYLKPNGFALINTDDQWGAKARDTLLDKGINVFSVGVEPSHDVQIRLDKPSLHVKGATSDEQLSLKLPGLHNRFNAAFGMLISEIYKLNRQQSIAALNHVEKVNGRFEIVYFPGNIKVVVDYAHTPKGFFHCLNTVKECGARRIIHVFGFRGTRDPSKRIPMMKKSLQVSDYYILTLDDLNETSEDEMEKELVDYQNRFDSASGEVITDRTLAIERAIQLAEEGDWVVITGKGHEHYQQDFALGTKTDLETVEKVYNHIQEYTSLS